MNESEKIEKYLDLLRDLGKTWNMKATVIPFIFRALGTTLKTWKIIWMTRRSEKESRPSRPQNCSNRLGYKKSPEDKRTFALFQISAKNDLSELARTTH